MSDTAQETYDDIFDKLDAATKAVVEAEAGTTRDYSALVRAMEAMRSFFDSNPDFTPIPWQANKLRAKCTMASIWCEQTEHNDAVQELSRQIISQSFRLLIAEAAPATSS